MADYIKIPTDFFESSTLRAIRLYQYSSEIINLYLQLLCEAYKHDNKGIFTIADIELNDFVLTHVFDTPDIKSALKTLESFGLICREERKITVYKFWDDLHDRNSQRYKDWRTDVFKRDGFVCRSCGTKKDLQAHHIIPWKNSKELRYSVDNGVTLCRDCHLKAHGGCWRSG